jgi:hypothetical protein
MCDLKIRGKEALHSYDQDIRGDMYYWKAMEFASASEKEEYNTIADNCLNNRTWSETCAKKQEECEEEIKKLEKSATSGDLCPEAKKKCQDIRAKAGAVSAAKRRMTGNWVWRLIRVWLIFSNLIPSIALVVLDFIKKINRQAPFLQNGYTVVYFCIGLMTMVLSFMILGQFDFFRDGVIRFILRLVGVYFIVGLNSALAYSRDNHLYYFAGCVVVNLLFYLVKGRQISADLKLVGDTIDNICPESVFDELKEKFIKGADEALAKKTQEYRQYYRTDDEWETSWNRWKESVGRENMVLLNKTREDVNYAER